jgi:hypothetical protein
MTELYEIGKDIANITAKLQELEYRIQKIEHTGEE